LNGSKLSDAAEREVDKFLNASSDTAAAAEAASAAQHLFAWLPSDATECEAATGHLPKNLRYAACVAFCRPDEEGGAASLQCMTLQPPVAAPDDPEEAAAAEAAAAPSPTTVLQALQLYTRQCFLPTVQSVMTDGEAAGLDVLSAKLRELDVALSASQRSARLPHVALQVPSERVVAAAARRTGDKLDWEALGLADALTDDELLNQLQAGVSVWVSQIRKVTVLPKSTPFAATDSTHAAAEEVAFWTGLQSELQSIQQQLKEPAVELTLAMLRETKRFVATLALENNTGLEQAVSHAADVNNFIRTYPLQQLQAARDFDKIVAANRAIFDHLTKVRTSRYYSLERSAQLLEATTAVLRESLLAVLQEQHGSMLFQDYKEYEKHVRFPVTDVFAQFDDRYEEWKDFMLEQARRRKQTGMNRVLEKMTLHHRPLQSRLDQLHDFRSAQERLREVVHTVLREDEPAALQQVEATPRQIFATVAVLDLSEKGSKALEAALEEYDLQMDAMEERLARLLRDKLQACQVCKFVKTQVVLFAQKCSRAHDYFLFTSSTCRMLRTCSEFLRVSIFF
jgi:dynein heavy chain 1